MMRWFIGHSFSALICVVTAIALAPLAASGQTRAEFEQWRQRLVDDILVPAGIKDPRVIQAMKDTPRHEFVPLPERAKSYYDMGLPIGYGQTISSPLIVSQMTQALKPQATDKVLEIGTGSGYQAAVLSKLVKEVYSIEIVPELGTTSLPRSAMGSSAGPKKPRSTKSLSLVRPRMCRSR
jgi:protein-L-isoaspartate(D-aspartate) O-methyltransferase